MKPFEPTFYTLTPKEIANLKPDTDTLVLNNDGTVDWDYYDYILISFSGGKDSTATWLWLLELGAPMEKIQIWHQLVDGELANGQRNFFDWAITEGYCYAIAAAMGVKLQINEVKLLFQWKHGGFEGEMLRKNSTTSAACFEDQKGDVGCINPAKPASTCSGEKGCGFVYDPATWNKTEKRYYVKQSKCPVCGQKRRNIGTRHKFPQIGPMDVMARTITNDPAFKDAKILMISGERRQESKQRRGLAEIVKHKGTKGTRRVTQWRPIVKWDEFSVWRLLERWSIKPHPCYYLGFGRCSCITCIYSENDQWATVREIDPDLIAKIAAYEKEFRTTIIHPKKDKRTGKLIKMTVDDLADQAEPFPEIFTMTDQLEIAMGTHYPIRDIFVKKWELPAGAGRKKGGPG
jgi:3'-phosphoadenosine 5'-phosphosulfate sulfotransferase (PAPS reductase)/FAD synthetase